MNEKFVREIYKVIVEDGCDTYKDLYENTQITDEIIEYWKNALELYQALDDNQKKIFIRVIKQTMIDTISSVFGVIDGSSSLGGEDYECELIINGVDTQQELQDTFLELVEEEFYG